MIDFRTYAAVVCVYYYGTDLFLEVKNVKGK